MALEEKSKQLGDLNSKLSQTQQSLSNERSKYQELSQQNKLQERELVSELALKNEQIFDLRKQIGLEE